MNAKDVFRSSKNMSLLVLNKYIADFNDADLMRRPSPGCNHLAWQLGHLISSEVGLVNMVCPGQGGELPAGFDEAHAKGQTGNDDPAAFLTKAEYVELMDKVHVATLAALEALPEEKFDAPGPERMRPNFPTVGDVFNLIAGHGMMHAGQFAVVRRQLGKPVVI